MIGLTLINIYFFKCNEVLQTESQGEQILINKAYKHKQGSSLSFKCLSLAGLVLSFNICAQQATDLVAGTDLTDSQLSLSLTTTITAPIGGHGKTIIINQYGISNTATINQQANSINFSEVSQDGFNNLAQLEQIGNGNIVNVDQYGDNNLANVIQEGDTNIANVKQEGEQSFIVHQIGNNMVVNITQY